MMKHGNDNSVEVFIKRETAEYVQIEGEKIIEEARKLNQEDSEPIPEENFVFINELCDRDSRKQWKQRKEERRRKIYMFFYKSAVAVAVIAIVVNLSIVSVPAMRKVALNFLITVTDECTYVNSYKGTQQETDIENNGFDIVWNKKYEVTYLPEGFSIFTESQDVCDRYKEYVDTNENYIYYTQSIQNTGFSLDSEHAISSQENVNSEQALCIEKKRDGETYITILFEADSYFILLESKGVSKEEMLKVARSIKLPD